MYVYIYIYTHIIIIIYIHIYICYISLVHLKFSYLYLLDPSWDVLGCRIAGSPKRVPSLWKRRKPTIHLRGCHGLCSSPIRYLRVLPSAASKAMTSCGSAKRGHLQSASSGVYFCLQRQDESSSNMPTSFGKGGKAMPTSSHHPVFDRQFHRARCMYNTVVLVSF